ncbi:aldehyde dehydrogenase (acceptor) [Saccharomonospora azurea SZMC 14600]|uniref:aldehyde dehydrogenase family protein n=1 Tax=Saccharomonospora azurea TaxID=40988 RepID=UPI00023FEDF6|nr:aldehyde dehydrogenase family protein [Saccharomonospora azurea]EHK83952.1 aldehyde dehydrogenase (acceptor) [Saccharomonospora azurea SZMC 14600]
MSTLFIDGRWVSATAGGTRQVVNPFDQSVIRTVDEAAATDAEAAVRAARAAFDDGEWRGWTARRRSLLLRRVAELLQRDRAEIARLETLDTGKTLVESGIDVDEVTSVFEYYATQAESDPGRLVDAGNPAVRSRVLYEPIGVCALIAPWNYPLLQIAWKVAPALAAGNTMVLKPSETTPLTTIKLVELLDEAGAPAGVANLVLGAGDPVGSTLTESPQVDMVSFTGGLATGSAIMASAARTVKKVALELGGKNPNIVFADADFEAAIDYALIAVFFHAGQVCSAGTRLVVEDALHDEFVAELTQRVERIKLGNGLDADTESGPLVSAEHREKVESYVSIAVDEGARLLTGGRRPDNPKLARGFFYLPTVFDDCHGGMRVVQEETFGPIMTVERFSEIEDAVRIGNDTTYGLAAAVWTGEARKAEYVARALRHGTVWINDFGPYLPQAEWGGYKRSGVGRELGHAGLAEYQEAKHIYENTAPEPQRWFAR